MHDEKESCCLEYASALRGAAISARGRGGPSALRLALATCGAHCHQRLLHYHCPPGRDTRSEHSVWCLCRDCCPSIPPRCITCDGICTLTSVRCYACGTWLCSAPCERRHDADHELANTRGAVSSTLTRSMLIAHDGLRRGNDHCTGARSDTTWQGRWETE